MKTTSFLILTLLSTGCVSTDTILSSDVAFEEIYADYELNPSSANPSEVNVKLQFRVGGSTGTTVEFDQGETLKAGDVVIERKTTGFEGTFYENTVPLPENGAAVTVIFTDKDSSPHSENVDIAQPLTLSSPNSGSSVDVQAGFNVTYTPAIPGKASLYYSNTSNGTTYNGTRYYSSSPDGSIAITDLGGIDGLKPDLSIVLSTSETSNLAPAGFQSGKISSFFETPELKLVAQNAN